MVDEETPADLRRRMDFDSREPARELGDDTRDDRNAPRVKPVRDPIGQHGMEARIGQDHLQLAGGCRVPFLRRRQIVFDLHEHMFYYIPSMRQTAWAVIASSRPTAPWPSPLLTLMLIRAGSTPIALARAPFMALRCGPSLGAWALMTASTLTTRQPFRVSMDMTASSSLRLEMSLYRLSDAGKCAPRSPSPNAPRRASHTACVRTSASE